MASSSRPWPLPRILGLLLGILGVGVAGAGAWLLTLGGSAYYLAAARPRDDLHRQGRAPVVLVVAGGHGSTGTKAGDFVIAYALPKK